MFGVSIVGHSLVNSVDIHAKGLGIIGTEYKLKDGEMMEKMGQPIRTRNLKKSGFSLVGNAWTKTYVAEGEAIIREASTAEGQEEEALVREDEPLASERRIEDIASELIEPFGQTSEGVIPPPAPAPSVIQESIDDLMASVVHTEGEYVDSHMEETRSVPVTEVVVEGGQVQPVRRPCVSRPDVEYRNARQLQEKV
ncbi:hypothetical protein Taro_011945 [Colocasia esculenta]|uniref:Uncharacterized protein n=1 Tax=Colocasia esculenta TaxID=4460 RepID=A0A843UBI0_COLES|nr:hypothetical protein [Colocasia esculenta]